MKDIKVHFEEVKPVKNQWQQAIWYILNWKSFSLKEIINDSMFYKFQTRLSEIESEHGEITEKSRKQFINRFGKTSNYMVYEKSVSDEKLKQIFKLY